MGGISTSDFIYGNVKYTKAILDYGIPAILVSSSISSDLYFNVLVAGGGACCLTLTYHSRYLSATLTTPHCSASEDVHGNLLGERFSNYPKITLWNTND